MRHFLLGALSGAIVYGLAMYTIHLRDTVYRPYEKSWDPSVRNQMETKGAEVTITLEAASLMDTKSFDPKGMYAAKLTIQDISNPTSVIESSVRLPQPTGFPAKLAFSFSESGLGAFFSRADRGLYAVFLNFCMNLNQEIGDCEANGPVAYGSKAISAFPSELGGRELDLGRLFFTRKFRFGLPWRRYVPCLPYDHDVKGTIVATQEFLKKFPKGRKLILTIHQSPFLPGTGSFFQSKVQVANATLDIQPFVPSVTGSTFSFPVSRFRDSDYFFAYVSVCEKGERTRDCSVRTYPFSSPTTAAHDSFRLIPEKFQVPHCADSEEHRFYLHWLESDKLTRQPELANKRDARLPHEVVIGQWL